ncbi:methyltransferase RsmF C-terminal domain-like protein [Algoriphagus sediminis]|uniref:tRNA/rRNA cytosine-C5-methylase n=1 Tax=Algoriphagus sediminis TaxID=3057113 RepID=A0ABT7YBQ4_9BACT|nr:tRNA/rRNA cytosine-C5-methylase [Algoriphagus sediminis]MDN3203923.1 tRNA/rRNA cytosine-C5-methylase [Algoriphagus sediminis]
MAKTELPKDFQKQMSELLGAEEFEIFSKALEKPVKTSIRKNPYKKSELSSIEERIPWSENGFILRERPKFSQDPLWHAGTFYVQESSSMFIDWVLRSLKIPKGIFLDMSAAPGGKSTLLSSYLGDEGLLVSNEVIQSRAQTLKENIIKWGLGNTVVTNNDPEHFDDLEGLFDCVLVDAPCSGEGMFRKDPNARNEWSLDNVSLCAARQSRILDHCGALVKGGGYLIYSTCTFNEKENEDMIRFLVDEFAFEPVRIRFEKEWGMKESEIETSEGTFFGYRFYPHRVPGEGFFIAILRRPQDSFSLNPKRSKDFKHPFLKEIRDTDSEKLDLDSGFDGNGKFYTLNDSYFRVLRNFIPELEVILRSLNVRYFGVELGKRKGEGWIPSPEWALSTLPKKNFSRLELSRNQALDFLGKKEMNLPEIPLGWHLITYLGNSLGWIKNLGNRINNYYPKDWRIRK